MVLFYLNNLSLLNITIYLKTRHTYYLIFLFLFFVPQNHFSQSYWSIEKDPVIQNQGTNQINIKNNPKYILDIEILNQHISNSKSEYILISLPNNLGGFDDYKVKETFVMPHNLQGKYPSIKTYKGFMSNDLTSTIRFSVTKLGIHGMSISGTRPTLFIEPAEKVFESKNILHIAYDKTNINGKKDESFECMSEINGAKKIDLSDELNLTNHEFNNESNDSKLRVYRTAITTTSQYSNLVIPITAETDEQKKEAVMSQIVATINRLNELYEKDLAVRLELVDNNDALIFLYEATDPFSSGVDNSTVAATIDREIGFNNYDIGHNFNTSGGGYAGIGQVCKGQPNPSSYQSGNHKGWGSSGASDPTNLDYFVLNVLAHEMGHQFYGWHTMNCNLSGNNSEVEPGGGTTVMAYGDFCSPAVQNFTDDYFHYNSLESIGGFLKNPFGANCSNVITVTNEPPTVDAGSDYTIPANTAFYLTGTGYDPETSSSEGGASLTYTWEQNDVQVATTPNYNSYPQSTWTNGPLYRSLPPSVSPIRYFPAFETVLEGSLSSTWEVTPSVSRELNFAFTARDNGSGNFGNDGVGQLASDTAKVTVIDTGDPFEVTSQNIENQMLVSGSTESVTWNVAGTTGSEINSQYVDIMLSTDGGETFGVTLGNNVENNGYYEFEVPNIPSLNCRIMVKSSDNIFYALNTSRFTIDYEINKVCYDYNSDENLNLSIADGPGANTPGAFTVASLDVAEDFSISDIDVYVNITHTYIWDLDVRIQHPDGETQSVLFYRDCDGEDNIDATFDDQAENIISCGENANIGLFGRFKTSANANIPLSTLNGTNSAGTWLLGVRDFYNEDIGTLNQFSMKICQEEATYRNPLSITELFKDSIEIYPNPSNEYIFVESRHDDLDIQIIDLSGRVLINSNNNEIFIGNLENGVYMIEISNKNNKIYKKIIKN